MTTTALAPITLPGEAFFWIETVLSSVEEEIGDSLKWLPMGTTTDAEIRTQVSDYGLPGADGDRMVALLIAVRNLDGALVGCRLPAIAEEGRSNG